jgi:IrrE N-terminal-like domain
MKNLKIVFMSCCLFFKQTAFTSGLLRDDEKSTIEVIAQRYLDLAKTQFSIKEPTRFNKRIVVSECQNCNCFIEEDENVIKISYDRMFYQKITRLTKVGFEGVIAHEIAHFVAGHTIYKNTKTEHERELEADLISGKLLMLSDVSFMSALEVISFIGECNSCESHPPLKKRLETIVKGWGKVCFDNVILPKSNHLTEAEKNDLRTSFIDVLNAYRLENIPPSLTLAGVILHKDWKFRTVCDFIKNKCKRKGSSPNKLISLYFIWECQIEMSNKLSLLSLYQIDDMME